MMRTHMCDKRHGLTLIELLVVLLIVGVVLAVLCQPSEMTREAGRRADCSNHFGCSGPR